MNQFGEFTIKNWYVRLSSMKKICFTLLFIFITHNLLAIPKEIKDIKEVPIKEIKSILSLFQASNRHTHGNAGEFSVKACPINKAEWLSFFILKKSFNQEYKFAQDCDIEGSMNLEPGDYAETNLKIRNLRFFDKFKIKVKITALPEKEFIALKIDYKDCTLSGGNNSIIFDGNYSVTINPLQKHLIQENKGGKIVIKKINNKVFNKTIELKMDK